MAVKDLYDKACEAANKGNYEYAIELYREVLRLSPDYAGARLLLRGTERRRLAEGGPSVLRTVAGRIKGLWPLLKATFQKDPAKKLEYCEDYLEDNPNRIGAVMMTGQAAVDAGYHEAAIAVFKDALSLRPNHPKALRALSAAFEQTGQIREALTAVLKLVPLAPRDRELQQKIKNLQAAEHMKSSRMDRAESFRDLIRDAEVVEQSVQRVETAGERRSREFTQAREAVEQDPENVTKITRLALLYRREDDAERAFQLLKAAHKRIPDNYEIRELLGDLQLHMFDDALRRADEQLGEKPGDGQLQERRRDLAARRKKYAAREYSWRVEQHPTDQELRMQLGKVQFETGRYNEAISAFQNATKDPRLALEASCMLGRCFTAKNQVDLALEQYHRALELHPNMDETGMEITYLMADALERMDDKDEALKLYKKIYARDIGFRDVADKVDSLNP